MTSIIIALSSFIWGFRYHRRFLRFYLSRIRSGLDRRGTALGRRAIRDSDCYIGNAAFGRGSFRQSATMPSLRRVQFKASRGDRLKQHIEILGI